ncbi:RNA polymerase II [Carex littledalei]|uniref:RNA polymerase II n=1 Tax=Carex littledalei TaxID=544730 RepID=A0A833RIM2_9POAL|nr:RNA polymerase II [Carex littledalei]
MDFVPDEEALKVNEILVDKETIEMLTRSAWQIFQGWRNKSKGVSCITYVICTHDAGNMYSLATGNWGQAIRAGIKARVSQVSNCLTYASSHLRRLNSLLLGVKVSFVLYKEEEQRE